MDVVPVKILSRATLNRIINMSFTWFNINAGYNNQLIKYSKNNGNSFTAITFPAGVCSCENFDDYIIIIEV